MRCEVCGKDTVSDASRYPGEYPCMNPACNGVPNRIFTGCLDYDKLPSPKGPVGPRGEIGDSRDAPVGQHYPENDTERQDGYTIGSGGAGGNDIIDITALQQENRDLRVRVEELEAEKVHLMKKSDEFSAEAHQRAIESRNLRQINKNLHQQIDAIRSDMNP